MDLIGVAGTGLLLLFAAAMGLTTGIVALQIIQYPLYLKSDSRTAQLIEPFILWTICAYIIFNGGIFYLILEFAPTWFAQLFLTMDGLPLLIVFVPAVIFLLRHKRIAAVSSRHNYALSDLIGIVFGVAFLPISAAALCGINLGIPDISTSIFLLLALTVIYSRCLLRFNQHAVPAGNVRATVLSIYPSFVLAGIALFFQSALVLAGISIHPERAAPDKHFSQLTTRLLVSVIVLTASWVLLRHARTVGDNSAEKTDRRPWGIDSTAATCAAIILLPIAYCGLDLSVLTEPFVDLGGLGGVYGTVDNVRAPQFAKFPDFKWPERGSAISGKTQKIELSINHTMLPAMLVRDFDDVLAAKHRLNISVNFRRIQRRLQALIRANNGPAVVLDLAKTALVRVRTANSSAFPISLVPSESAPGTKYADSVFAIVRGHKLIMGAEGQPVESEWPHPGLNLLATYYFDGYPLALAPIIDFHNGHVSSIAVLDVTQRKLAAEIPWPDDAYKPDFIIDPETDGALIIDEESRYAICVDLLPVITPASKSACKDYPRFDSTVGPIIPGQ